mmetsp:Transcript_2939/g.4783  ORF Transcript_2939/g.4783 Transcript_2939/m.4783 type:complete len:220 (+) Transcript_2939:416-1075(+)
MELHSIEVQGSGWQRPSAPQPQSTPGPQPVVASGAQPVSLSQQPQAYNIPLFPMQNQRHRSAPEPGASGGLERSGSPASQELEQGRPRLEAFSLALHRRRLQLRPGEGLGVEEDCAICLEPLSLSGVVERTGCGHLFHFHCAQESEAVSVRAVQHWPCPHCRSTVSYITTKGFTECYNLASTPAGTPSGSQERTVSTDAMLLETISADPHGGLGFRAQR